MHEDGRPVYLSEDDIEEIREYMEEDNEGLARDIVEERKYDYEVRYRVQQMTLQDILTELTS